MHSEEVFTTERIYCISIYNFELTWPRNLIFVCDCLYTKVVISRKIIRLNNKTVRNNAYIPYKWTREVKFIQMSTVLNRKQSEKTKTICLDVLRIFQMTNENIDMQIINIFVKFGLLLFLMKKYKNYMR